VLDKIITADPEIQELIIKNNFAEAAEVLLKNQKESWKQLSEGYQSLRNVKIKNFSFDGFDIRVQHNPKRIISSSAKVDNESIKKRECFLCAENLPVEQKGILYNNKYIILGNPFPIFPAHLTLSYSKHSPQRIENSFGDLLLLARDLSRYFTVFYNGPECGASAPDHLHFQAGTKNFMPVEEEFNQLKLKYGKLLYEKDNLSVNVFDDGLRRFLSLESNNLKLLKNSFKVFYDTYLEFSNGKIEPMMNILAVYDKFMIWRVLIFLREKHRPSFFYDKGEGNFLWSPAAVDLGGVCIIPKQENFNNISRNILITGFNQITISSDKFSLIYENLKQEISVKY
jgi:ATP adenylyltransferase/5',5'''-P-1,P-4-tetraphosphate phosphorylase II